MHSRQERLKQVEKDKTFIPQLFELATQVVNHKLSKGEHPVDAAIAGAVIIDSYLWAREGW